MASRNCLDSPDSYAIAWIAALPIERAAAEAMLDEEHAAPSSFIRHQTDANVYTWGRMGEHNIVIASLAAGVYGTTSAATTASSLLASLPSIRVDLMVGIGGGIAQPTDDRDIRLDDIVVSQPDSTTGGVCQYDLIKARSGDKRERKGFLGRPPAVLLHALASIQADHERKDSKVPCFLQTNVIVRDSTDNHVALLTGWFRSQLSPVCRNRIKLALKADRRGYKIIILTFSRRALDH
ncbi:NACHT ankyrin domain-containing protein [Fusarium heterosporum]|uniref:NACHT ankyrin domain-containing protein n=1 Tax=Fusarium heterosporum TaxID=42747 RepID=A0A8H5WXH7_FUSHE|nr:NACHT ankyrin domain-containing protein [Fusarium heterosporum]